MAAAVADRVRRESAPERVEKDLSALWRDVGRAGPIARAMMANLLVVRSAGPAAGLKSGATGESAAQRVRAAVDDDAIEAVAGRHPSRVIVIDYAAPPSEGPGLLTAAVEIVTYGPASARYGVEQVAVRSNCAEASLPSLVRRFARGDLPISVWWTDDFSTRPLIAPLVDIGRQLVFDSRQWNDVPGGFRAIAPWLDLDIIDINWRRLAPLRRGIVFAARCSLAPRWDPARVRIGFGARDSALAWLLAGWLCSRLEWSRDTWPHVDADPNRTDGLSVAIDDGIASTVVTLDAERVIVECAGAPPSSIGVPLETDADAIAAELHTLSRDTCLQDALRALSRRFGCDPAARE